MPNYFPSRFPGSQETPAWNTQTFPNCRAAINKPTDQKHVVPDPLRPGHSSLSGLGKQALENEFLNEANKLCVPALPDYTAYQDGPG